MLLQAWRRPTVARAMGWGVRSKETQRIACGEQAVYIALLDASSTGARRASRLLAHQLDSGPLGCYHNAVAPSLSFVVVLSIRSLSISFYFLVVQISNFKGQRTEHTFVNFWAHASIQNGGKNGVGLSERDWGKMWVGGVMTRAVD